jgi:hypothetical protein
LDVRQESGAECCSVERSYLRLFVAAYYSVWDLLNVRVSVGVMGVLGSQYTLKVKGYQLILLFVDKEKYRIVSANVSKWSKLNAFCLFQ